MLVRAENVVKEWAAGATRTTALRGVSFEVRRGERVAILGKSGSGKSTLLNLLGGLDRPSAGRIEVDGLDLARLGRDGLARYRQTTVGMIFQSFHLVPTRTALGNVELPLVFAGLPRAERRERAEAVLEVVGLRSRLGHYPPQLSGGEQQRVAIARALVVRPRLLLCDEPTGNLDSDNAALVMDLLQEHRRQGGATLLLVTHDEELALKHTDRVLRMKDGLLLS